MDEKRLYMKIYIPLKINSYSKVCVSIKMTALFLFIYAFQINIPTFASDSQISKIIEELKRSKKIAEDISQKLYKSIDEIIKDEKNGNLHLALRKLLEIYNAKSFQEVFKLKQLSEYVCNKTLSIYANLSQKHIKSENIANFLQEENVQSQLQNIIKSNIDLFFQKLQDFLTNDLFELANSLVKIASKIPHIEKDEKFMIAKSLIAEAQNNESDLKAFLSVFTNKYADLYNTPKLNLFWKSSLTYLQLLVDPRLIPPSNITQMISEKALSKLSNKTIKKRLAAVSLYSQEQLEAEGLYYYIKALLLTEQYDEANKALNFFRNKYSGSIWLLKIEDFIEKSNNKSLKTKLINDENIDSINNIFNKNIVPATPSISLGESF